MKKIIFISVSALLFAVLLHGVAMADNIKLKINKVECVDEKKIVVEFTIVNTRNFNHPNVSICFKILKDEIPVAGKELRVTVPANSDGSIVYQADFETPCGEGGFGLKSAVFHNAKRYSIENWFKVCPGTWKSKGDDKLEEMISGQK